MLGLKNQNSPWEWAVVGKHPSFNDYLNFNGHLPLVQAFAAWVERGSSRAGKGISVSSFRFLTMGLKRGRLSCGIIRSSSDTMGRLYPLIIMGCGEMKNWEKGWQKMFHILAPLFRGCEDLTSKRFRAFNEFEMQLKNLTPEPELPDLPLPNSLDPTGAAMDKLKEILAGPGQKEEMISLPLNLAPALPSQLVSRGGRKKIFGTHPSPPNTIFLGGVPEKTEITAFTRPLVPEDFIRLFKTRTDLIA